MVSQRSSPVSLTVTGAPARSRRTSEQVASKERPAMSAGSAAASARAWRRAAAAACQIWAEDCSAWPSASRISSGASARASRRPEPSKMPARALAVPMSMAATRGI
jgi:hypothetical protein